LHASAQPGAPSSLQVTRPGSSTRRGRPSSPYGCAMTCTS
jgi:hypothetical protein